MRRRVFTVYIMVGASGTLYVGITSDLPMRVYQHKKKLLAGFTRRYNIDRLVYWESFGEVTMAIRREKEIKGWKRDKKIRLIESRNPHWNDLATRWFSLFSSKSERGCHPEARSAEGSL